MVTRPEDILEELNLAMVVEQRQTRELLPSNEVEALLLSKLSDEPVHVDELQHHVNMPISEVTGTMALMELKGMVRQVGGMKYVIARESGVEYVVD
jgi:DNA processing protein